MKKTFFVLVSGLFSLSVTAQTNRISSARNQEEKLNEAYCSGFFRSADGTILDVASNSTAGAYLNVLDWLQGRVAGLQVYTSQTGTSILVIRGAVPTVYLDEVPISLNMLNLVNTNDIAIVKIIKTPFMGGFGNGNGAIAIYTLGTEEEDEEHETE